MDQVERFLESNDLKSYKEYFEEESYDSMPQLLSRSSNELMSVCDATKTEKTGHIKRFIAAIGILKSKKAQEEMFSLMKELNHLHTEIVSK